MLNIPTNCGPLDLGLQFANDALERTNRFRQNHIDMTSPPDINHGRITYFHNVVCSWAFSVPLKFDWVVVINAKNKNYILNEIDNIGNKYESKGWNVGNSARQTNIPTVQDVIGCIFAQGVQIPGEKSKVERAGISEGSNRGYINAPIISGRNDFDPLQIGFLETNNSFIDSFLRPWNILVSHKGLIATPDSSSIKADIILHQLARNGSDVTSIVRKTFVFEDCAPISISPETLDYNPSSDFPKIQVEFSYSKYYITDGFQKTFENSYPQNKSKTEPKKEKSNKIPDGLYTIRTTPEIYNGVDTRIA